MQALLRRLSKKADHVLAERGKESMRKRMGAKSIDSIVLGIVEGIASITPILGFAVLGLEFERHRARQLGVLPQRYEKPKTFAPDMGAEIRDVTSHIIRYNMWKSRFGLRMNLKYKTAKDYVTLPEWLEKDLYKIAYLPKEQRLVAIRALYGKKHPIPANSPDFEKSLKYLNDAADEKIKRMKGWFSVIYRKENKSFDDFYGFLDVLSDEKAEEKKLQKRLLTKHIKDLKKDAIKTFGNEDDDKDKRKLLEAYIFGITPDIIIDHIAYRATNSEKAKTDEMRILDYIASKAPKIDPAKVKAYIQACNDGKQQLDQALFNLINSNDPYESSKHKKLRELMVKLKDEQLKRKKDLDIEEENDRTLANEIWMKQMSKIQAEIDLMEKRKKDKRKSPGADTIREIMGQYAQVSQIGSGWIAYNTDTGVAHLWGIDPKEYPAAFQKFEKFAHDRGDFWRGMVECHGPPELMSSFETYCRERSIRSAQLFGHPHAFLLSEITQEIIGNAEGNHARGAIVIRVLVVDAEGNPRYEKDGKLMYMNVPIWNAALCDRNSAPHPKSMMKCFRSDDYWPETNDPCVVTGYSAMNRAEKVASSEVVAYVPMDENGQIINDMAFHCRLLKTKKLPPEVLQIINEGNASGNVEGRMPAKGDKFWEESGAEAGAMKKLAELRIKGRAGELKEEGEPPNSDKANPNVYLAEQFIKLNDSPAPEPQKADYIINTLRSYGFPKEITEVAIQLLSEGYLSMDSMKKKDMIKYLEEQLEKPESLKEDPTKRRTPPGQKPV